MTYSTVLRELAVLIDRELPPPTNVTLGGPFVPSGTVRVTVERDDLSPWLAALDLAEPAWHGDSEAGLMFALWPPEAFEGMSFRLVCIATQTAAVA